ncbi:MAG: PAS domain S-box protein [Gemmatimonadota bacterium]
MELSSLLPTRAPARRGPRGLVSRYGVAVGAVLAFALLRLVLAPMLGSEAPVLLFMFAIFLSGWWGGLGPGLVATALSAFLATLLFLDPVGALTLTAPADQIRIGLLVLIGILTSVMAEALWRSLRREVGLSGALEEAERRWRLLLDILPAGMYVCDADGRITFFNEMAADLWGRRPQTGEAAERFFGSFRLFRPDGTPLPHHETPMAEAVRGGPGCRSQEVVVEREDGERATALASVQPVRDESGKLNGAINVLADVTELLETQERLRRHEQRLAFVLDAAGVGEWTVDLETGRMDCSERCRVNFAVPPGEPFDTYEHVRARIHPEDRDAQERAVAEAIRTGREYQAEYRLRPTDGPPRWILARGNVVSGPAGVPAEMTGITMDITDRKRAEERLRESEERFREMTDRLPLLVWAQGEDGEQIFVNNTFCRYFGVQRDEMKADRWMSLMHPDDPDTLAYATAFAAAVRERRPFRGRVRVRRSDGEWRWLESWGRPRFDAVGHYLGHIGVSADITERKFAEERLLEQDERKDLFLATLAHELRNPLAPLQSCLEILRLEADESERSRRTREVMERQLTTLVRLIDDLLDVARVSKGHMELRTSRLDLREAIQAAVELSRPLIERRGHALTLHLSSQPVWIEADSTRLAQVFGNLLTNAAKYTDSGGRIDVSLTQDEATVAVRVADTGRGIPPDRLAEVFDMFTQVHGRDDAGQGGLGIGLALVRKLVDLHGGRVEVESAGRDRGSAFTVHLPLAPQRSRERAVPAGEEIRHAPSPARRRILVVDDNRDAAETLARVLTLLGHETHLAFSGASALTSAQALEPDAVFCDIGMPDMDGHEVARRLRAQQHDGLLLVAITGWGTEDDRARALGAGFDLHLTKPIDAARAAQILTRPA